MKFILGKKLEMTQVFREDGDVVPVTLVAVQPNYITQVKTSANDGYTAVQVAEGKAKHVKKPQVGHLKDLPLLRNAREFRVSSEESSGLKRGDQLTAAVFQAGDEVEVTGVSKGRGFQGVVKRHGFHGSPATHGHKDQLRMPGSIGAGGVQRVFKGMRMPGRMGGDQVTVKGLEVVEVDEAKGLLYIKGALPGARNGLLLIKGPGVLELKAKEAETVAAAEPVVAEEVAQEPEVVEAATSEAEVPAAEAAAAQEQTNN